MPGVSSKTKEVTVRIPLGILDIIEEYSTKNKISRSQAIIHYIQAGIATENSPAPATKDDIDSLRSSIALKDDLNQVREDLSSFKQEILASITSTKGETAQSPSKAGIGSIMSGWRNNK